MSALDDPEDPSPPAPPPTVPETESPFPPLPPWASSSSFPPPPALPSTVATTEPSPPSEKPGDEFSIIIRKLDELLELRRVDAARLTAIDLGVKVLFERLDVLEVKVEKLIQICTDEGNGLFAISKDLQDLRTSVLQQKDFDGAKVKRLEQSVADLERAAGNGGE